MMLWVLLLFGGCSSPEPQWMLDVASIGPEHPDDGLVGTQTWQFYRSKWSRNQRAKHYLCSTIVQLDAVPSLELCERCERAWSIETTVISNDCDTSAPAVPHTYALGFGGDAQPGDEFPEGSLPGWIDNGYGWERHGWVYPQNVDTRSEDWVDVDQATWWPLFAWDLEQYPDTNVADSDASGRALPVQ